MNFKSLSAKPFYESLLFNIQKICRENSVDDTHGFAHAVKIGSQTQKAVLSCEGPNFSEVDAENVALAAYLHDIDDRKFFKTSDYSNATKVLSQIGVAQKRITQIVKMIDLVSFSKNGNKISSEVPVNYYLPRYVDRSEAIGVQGLYRSYAYNMNRNSKELLYDNQTPKPHTFQQASQTSKGRDLTYMRTGKSRTIIDHFFDKLIHIQLPKQIQNIYLQDLYKRKQKEMIDFIIANAAQNYVNYQANLLRQYELNKCIW